MQRVGFALIFTCALLAGVILLQIYLSRRESKWPGLVLPVITFLVGLLYPLSMAVPPEGVTVSFLIQMMVVWLLGNIPTIILLAIYFDCRGKQRRRKQLEKMNIQDLD